ncbi:MAG: NAD+ synthase [Planctomycetes bacterium]|nr:NAD+ synthase [Planctomycetota bacterium]
MRIALVQADTTQGDLPGNAERILAACVTARRAGADLAIFPELALAGYCPRDLVYRPSFLAAAAEQEAWLAARLPEGLSVLVGNVAASPSANERRALNTAVLLERGRVGPRVAKRLLPNYDVFDEARWFQPGPSTAPVMIAGRSIGITICEDVWVGEAAGRTDPGTPDYGLDPAADLVAQGAELVVNLSASPFSDGKPARREFLVQSLAKRLGRPVVLCNLIGGNDELIFDGHSLVAMADGRTAARALGFDEDLVVWDWDGTRASQSIAPQDEAPLAAIYRALVLGVRDYARKSGFRRALLGLSGGIDSALCAVIAADALGAENVSGVAMPTRYSAEMSEEDAQILARNLGLDFRTIPIEEGFRTMLASLEPHFDGKPADVTEENIQPRLRGLVLMALSNKHGSLLLSTGNKSELAVGYCTLYGDMCGGLAVISDLPKTTVFALARYLNATRGEIIPMRTIERPPSAELRPDQKDSDSLPDYLILDDILRRSVEELQSLEDIVAAGHDENCVRSVLERLWRNEYKRKQMPPGLRVTSKAFGSGRRMPITGSATWYENRP